MACAAGALLLVAACTQPSRLVAPEPSDVTGSPGVPLPVEVARWGRLGSLVSVELRNPNAAAGLLDTRFQLVARDELGAVLARTPAPPLPGDPCCTIYELPPDGVHRAYLSVATRAADVAEIEIEIDEAHWLPWTARVVPVATVTGAHLHPAARSAYVSGRLSVEGLRDAHVSVQVSLDAPDGRLVAVIAALLGCYRDARDVPFRVDLFERLPAGTRLGAIRAVAFPAARYPRLPLARC